MVEINNASYINASLPPPRTEKWFVQELIRLSLKRCFDFLVASVLLIVLAPFMLLIAVLVRLDSRGNPVFTQERVGSRIVYQNGRFVRKTCVFKFRKFRSMYATSADTIHREFVQAMIMEDEDTMTRLQRAADAAKKAEDNTAPDSQDTDVSAETDVSTEAKDEDRYKLKKDSRITPIGQILRKTSLDELPQLWNVVIGDMSLVGPRPPIPYEVEVYSPHHMLRLSAQPGITGLWQVTARSSASFDEMVELDLQYIRNQSLWLDIKILFKTIGVLFHQRGAR